MGGAETIIASTSLALSLSPYEKKKHIRFATVIDMKGGGGGNKLTFGEKKGKMMKTFSFAPEDQNWNDNATRNGKRIHDSEPVGSLGV